MGELGTSVGLAGPSALLGLSGSIGLTGPFGLIRAFNPTDPPSPSNLINRPTATCLFDHLAGSVPLAQLILRARIARHEWITMLGWLLVELVDSSNQINLLTWLAWTAWSTWHLRFDWISCLTQVDWTTWLAWTAWLDQLTCLDKGGGEIARKMFFCFSFKEDYSSKKCIYFLLTQKFVVLTMIFSRTKL